LEHVARSKYGDFDEVVSRQDQIPVIAINIMYEIIAVPISRRAD